MPIEILVPMVGFGIAGIALLLHLLGLSKRNRFVDEAAAKAVWLDEFPGHLPRRIVLSRDRVAACVETDHGHGIVWPMGADSTARYLEGAPVTRTSTGVRIDLPDFTAPRITLVLDEDELANWPILREAPR